MPQVAVRINNKTYRIACEVGQEAHLLDLASRFDDHISSLRREFGEIGDQRLTVMAGIMAQDELSDLRKRVDDLESQLKSLRRSGSRDSDVVALVHKAADRVESLTNRLRGEAEQPQKA